MVASVIGISLIALIASLAFAFAGVRDIQFLVLLAQIGLPVGFLLIIALLIVSIRRRNRDN